MEAGSIVPNTRSPACGPPPNDRAPQETLSRKRIIGTSYRGSSGVLSESGSDSTSGGKMPWPPTASRKGSPPAFTKIAGGEFTGWVTSATRQVAMTLVRLRTISTRMSATPLNGGRGGVYETLGKAVRAIANVDLHPYVGAGKGAWASTIKPISSVFTNPPMSTCSLTETSSCPSSTPGNWSWSRNTTSVKMGTVSSPSYKSTDAGHSNVGGSGRAITRTSM
mmetsp:Transcript_52759/g.140214  ORF Transcript_52759/g.140214 Transcript_52759/m.140214 type:complete len:222 (-) Transcript_52759:367-1032(-)